VLQFVVVAEPYLETPLVVAAVALGEVVIRVALD
jgi:hypothetical protein